MHSGRFKENSFLRRKENMVLNSKQILKLALIGAVSTLIIVGLTKCSKKSPSQPPSAVPSKTAEAPQVAHTTQETLQKFNARPIRAPVIDQDLIPEPQTPKKDPNEEKDSDPPMF